MIDHGDNDAAAVVVAGLTRLLFTAILAMALAVALPPSASAAAVAKQMYAVTPLLQPSGWAGIDAAPGINSEGEVTLDIYGGSCCDYAGVWSNGVSKLLPFNVSGCGNCNGYGSDASAINADGQITGSVDYTGGPTFAAYREATSGATTLIPRLGGPSSEGNDINGAGQVVGASDTASGTDHAFLWDGTTTHDLGTLGGENSEANASYASGQAVGCAQTAAGDWHPFLYTGGKMTDLGLPAGMTYGCAVAINSAGTILGYANPVPDPADVSQCATWTWSADKFTILPKENGYCLVNGNTPGSGALDAPLPTPGGGHISNTGQVVGGVPSDGDGNTVPVVEQSGVDQIIVSGQTPFDPEAANDDPANPGWAGGAVTNNLHGQIVVESPFSESFLFTPITISDENAAAIKYSTGWRRLALAGSFGGHVEQGASGKSLTMSFTGKTVSLIGVSGGLGTASVVVDGKGQGTVSEAGAAATRTRLDTIRLAASGKHTLKVTVTSGTFELDAITVASE